MIRRDFKIRTNLDSTSRAQRFRRHGLIALFVAGLCGTAILVSANSSDSNPPATAENKVAPLTTSTPIADTATQDRDSNSERQAFEQVSLALPTPATQQDQDDGAAVQEAPDAATSSVETTIAAPQAEIAAEDPTNTETTPKPGLAHLDDTEDDATQSDLPSDKWLETQVKNGDSLARIFSRLDLSANLLHRIVHSSKQAKQLARIRPGETIRVRIDDEDAFKELIHKQTAVKSLRILAKGEEFTTEIIDRPLESRVTHASGIITSSLFEGALRAGLSESLTMELANIFGWDIDFALEIRAGDSFSLVYEEEYLDGKKYRNGPILAAEFVNRGKVFRAIRYEDAEGYASYFSPDGNSMRKAFLRAPVDFRRISSRFTRARWHPVLGKKRPHRGVDYSARTGTPIKAAGNGRVIFRGTKGGYGRTVIIQHGQKYTTLYAHMSKYRSKVKNGSRVQQGQVIGYVGKSGLATGPHLHYEFRVNGVHRNPLTVKLPAALPIDKKYRADFLAKSEPLLSQLDNISQTLVAEADTSN